MMSAKPDLQLQFEDPIMDTLEDLTCSGVIRAAAMYVAMHYAINCERLVRNARLNRRGQWS
ncbi:MAG: hypothetical protein QNK34_07980 [Woeseiaceae bacterium]|nr:hypothetical protein [Woeseiaceae bacterium]